MTRTIRHSRKKIDFVIFLKIFILTACTSPEVEKVYYEEGTLEYIVSLRNGKKNGLLKKYYKSGELMLESNWKDGKRHGKATSYYKNGKIKDEGFFVDDIPNGQYEFFDSLGNTREKSLIKDGHKHGENIVYSDKGKILSKLNFFKGKLQGKGSFYNTDGSIKGKYVYHLDTIKYSIDYLENNLVTNQSLTYNITPIGDTSISLREGRKLLIQLKYPYHDYATVGVVLGKFNVQDVLYDTLKIIDSDSLSLVYTIKNDEMDNEKLSGYIYELIDTPNGKEIENQIRFSYPH